MAKRDVLVAKRHQRTREAPEIVHFYRIMRRKRRVGGKARRVGGKEAPEDARGAGNSAFLPSYA